MHGFIAINKPIGLSSATITNKVKREINNKKIAIGHTGTLDPLATGVLVIALGHATRFIRFLSPIKEYVLEITLGRSTTTFDVDGDTLEELAVPHDYFKVLPTILHTQFTGEIEQVAPKYSALKYKGKALYKYARKDIEVPSKSRNVSIYKIDCLSIKDKKINLKVKCGSGVYMRSLAHDLGIALNTCAHLSKLVRTSCNGLDIIQAIELNKSSNLLHDIQEKIVTANEFLAHLPKINLNASEAKLIRNGMVIDNAIAKDFVRLYFNNEFIGIGNGSGSVIKVARLIPSNNDE